MYGLRLFIVVLQELHYLPNCLHVCVIRVRGCYHITKFFALYFMVFEIATNVNTLPEAAYCILQELHCLPNCLHIFMIRVITSPSFVTLHLRYM